ncbi:hypothetical protein C8J57DRAFT_1513863 [Mycena rebaudengoi]|nr:hypothetical protein C8J57DRAFT_1513863 [Mycena rebaudengoi]
MSSQSDFQGLKAPANLAVKKLYSSKKTTDNTQLKHLYSELILALNASSSRINEHTESYSDTARIVKLVHNIAEIFLTYEDRAKSISCFLEVHMRDLECVLTDVHENTEPDGADEEQNRSRLEGLLGVLVQDLALQGANKKPSQVTNHTEVHGNYNHTVVNGNQMNNTLDPSLFHSFMAFQNRNPAISPPADLKPMQGLVENEE